MWVHMTPMVYQDIKILKGEFGGRDYGSDTWHLYLLYFALHVQDKLKLTHIGGQQLKQDAVREQQLERTQSGRSSVGPRETSARPRPYPHKAVGASEYKGRLRQTHTDMVEEVRPRKHNYVCSEERTIVHCQCCANTKESEWLLHHEELQVPDCSRIGEWSTGWA